MCLATRFQFVRFPRPAAIDKGHAMTRTTRPQRTVGGVLAALTMLLGVVHAQDAVKQQAPSRNSAVKPPVVKPEDFASVMTRMQGAKAAIEQRHLDLLKERSSALIAAFRAESPTHICKYIR